jgi:hypothetical protein
MSFLLEPKSLLRLRQKYKSLAFKKPGFVLYVCAMSKGHTALGASGD